MCATGYALSGICLPLAARVLLRSSVAFWVAMGCLGLPSAATLTLTFISTSRDQGSDLDYGGLSSSMSKRAVLIGLLGAATNFLGTLYLQWRYLLSTDTASVS